MHKQLPASKLKILLAFLGFFISGAVWSQADEVRPAILVMPNTFSPNNDGVNDRFTAVTIERVFNPQIYIFDRWGEQLYYSVDLTAGWDGRFEGEHCPPGNYAWFVLYENEGFEDRKQGGFLFLTR